MTLTDDYRYRAAETVMVKSKHAMDAMALRRREASVTPGGGAQDDAERAAFDEELYRETEHALAMAAAAVAELETAGEG
jgi:hypothetical protein